MPLATAYSNIADAGMAVSAGRVLSCCSMEGTYTLCCCLSAGRESWLLQHNSLPLAATVALP